MLLRPLLLLQLLLPPVLAAFTHDGQVCWGSDCIIRADAGTLCFEPHYNDIRHEECADIFLKNLTQVHLASTFGPSILYYDDRAHVFGAATWSIPPSMEGSAFVCMTGPYTDDPKRYRTVCREAHSNDDMEIAAAHSRECFSDQKPRQVSDGCFSLEKSSGGNGDHREWYEEPVVAGIFWVLGALITLGSICLWGGKAVRAVQAWLTRHLVKYGVIVAQPAHTWRRSVPPPPTQQFPIISNQPYINGTIRRPDAVAMTDRTANRPSEATGVEAGTD